MTSDLQIHDVPVFYHILMVYLKPVLQLYQQTDARSCIVFL